MEVKLLYSTPDYHKLAETTARICYQSFHKLSPDSHKMLKGIMGTGHVSVASVGNIVFGINVDEKHLVNEYGNTLDTLNVFKQINSFVRWTDKSHKKNKQSKFTFIISLNMLSLMEIHKHIHEYDLDLMVYNKLMDEVKKVPELYWFFNKDVKLDNKENQYKLDGRLGEPHLLTEDYSQLKDKLTSYELETHSQICFHLEYDRATSLQMWRHRLVGGTEMSQRYVDQSNAKYRIPNDLEGEDRELFKRYMQQEIEAYTYLKEKLSDKGKKRSQEIARNLLPNILTSVIQQRSLKDWRHLIKLRDTNHAQKEIMEDIQAVKKEFDKLGIKFDN